MSLSVKWESIQRMPKMVLGLCIILTVIPGFLARLDMFYIDDMVWFLLLFPCFIFSYYLGFAGGVFAALAVNVYHLFWFMYEKYLRMAELVNQELSLHIGVAIVTFLCAIGVGLLSEKLTEKQMQLQSLNQKLKHLALYDSLTSLPNRHYFMERLSESLQGEPSVSLLFVDLDGFKKVNDTYGHDEGDRILIKVANQLKHCCRDSMFVSRLGGDEFIVMLVGADQEKSIETAQEILKKLQLNVHDLWISASIGVAISKHGDTPSTLLKSADSAMYHVKSRGKNAVGA
ncbi:GGDEF domain-containing protein [Neobacillus bataviensis LMG 21833]|uniref:GGDEF domain-containing protein n=1 Tax=Neobacillus bataviensis LMG 21833 TaxID=1117379 RepID=K6D0E1_9BACI|nr:GGDEF domain-containing protein [Neobacillus bataviensis]EKN65942.1 GGDEF domain-containing protein [Neobacillus bataviensis LMG 21833]